MVSEQFKKLRIESKERDETGKRSRTTLQVLESQTYKDLLEQEKKCAKCHRTENLTLDHIIPRHFLEMFGIDTEREYIDDNYQILCRVCNQFKSNRIDFSNPISKTLLIKLLERI